MSVNNSSTRIGAVRQTYTVIQQVPEAGLMRRAAAKPTGPPPCGTGIGPFRGDAGREAAPSRSRVQAAALPSLLLRVRSFSRPLSSVIKHQPLGCFCWLLELPVLNFFIGFFKVSVCAPRLHFHFFRVCSCWRIILCGARDNPCQITGHPDRLGAGVCS